MSHDRITQLRISGLRTIEDLTLDLNGLTVLIGENGTGKSSILEALELLRQAAAPVEYVPDIIVRGHGGLQNLQRRGAERLRLGVTIEGAGPKLTYDLALANRANHPEVASEVVKYFARGDAPPLTALQRTGTRNQYFDVSTGRLEPLADSSSPAAEGPLEGTTLALRWINPDLQPTLRRLHDALARIELHVPFETRPLWQQRAFALRQGPRWPALVEAATELPRYGFDLPNAFQQVRNIGPEAWSRVLSRVQLGLYDDIRDLRMPPTGRGEIDLELVLANDPDHPLPVHALSEGQLSYLCFVALVELNPERAILAFDEPELHLHPALLPRVVWMLEEAAERSAVVLATHSDHLLDCLENPAESVVVCELDERNATRLRRLDPERLAEWLEDYTGFGSIRGDGYTAHVLADFVPSPKEPVP